MSDKFDIRDDYAKDALQTPLKSCKYRKTRNAWQRRLVLDFTASRPAAKSEVTIGKAEEFLASLLTEDDDGRELQKVRKRLFSDFPFYAKSALKSV